MTDMSDEMNGSGSGGAEDSGGPEGTGGPGSARPEFSDSGDPGGAAGSCGPRGPGGLGGLGGGKRLERKLSGRFLAGVCAGLADYSGIDASLIRVIFLVLTLFGGVGAIAYVLAWALVPEEGESVSIAEKVINKSGT
jgi:phage shock protein C